MAGVALFVDHTVKDVTYRVRRMPPMQQLHVSRRLAPLLTGVAGILGALKAPSDEQLRAAKPFADALAALPDADAEYIVGTSLATVSRSADNGKTWSALYSPDGRVCMADDLGLDVTLPLVVFVVKQALGPFIADFLTSPPGEEVSA